MGLTKNLLPHSIALRQNPEQDKFSSNLCKSIQNDEVFGEDRAT